MGPEVGPAYLQDSLAPAVSGMRSGLDVRAASSTDQGGSTAGLALLAFAAVRPARRQCPVCSPMNPLMQISEVSVKVCFVGPPSQSINAGGRIAFEREERHPE